MINVLPDPYGCNPGADTSRDKRCRHGQGITYDADAIDDGPADISLLDVVHETLDAHGKGRGIPGRLEDLPVRVNMKYWVVTAEGVRRESHLSIRQRIHRVPACDVRVVETGAVVEISQGSGCL